MSKIFAESLIASSFTFSVRTSEGCATFNGTEFDSTINLRDADSATFSIPMDKNGILALACKKEYVNDLKWIFERHDSRSSSSIFTENNEYWLFKAPDQPIVKDALTPQIDILSTSSPSQRILIAKTANCIGLKQISQLPAWLQKVLCEEQPKLPFTQKDGISFITALNGSPNNPELFQNYFDLGLSPIPIDPVTREPFIKAPGYGTPKSEEEVRIIGVKYPGALCGLLTGHGLVAIHAESFASSHAFGLYLGTFGVNVDETSRIKSGDSTTYIFSTHSSLPFTANFLRIKGLYLRGDNGYFISGPGQDTARNTYELVDVGLLDFPISLTEYAISPTPIILESENETSCLNVLSSTPAQLSEVNEFQNHPAPKSTQSTVGEQLNQNLCNPSKKNGVIKEKLPSCDRSIRKGMTISREKPLSEEEIKAHPNYPNLELAEKVREKGIRVCWVDNETKKPFYSEEMCGDKQGLTLDENTLRKRFVEKIDTAMPLMEINDEFFVIDLDIKHEIDGITHFEDHCKALRINMDSHPQVRSPSGGLHIYCRKPQGINLTNAPFPSKNNCWGDIKTTNGLIGVPGAMGKRGEYEIINGDPFDFTNLPECPEPILQFLIGVTRNNEDANMENNAIIQDNETERGTCYLDWCCGKIISATEGVRNTTLFTESLIIGRLIKKNEISQKTAFNRLIEAGRKSGLSYSECKSTVKSGIERGVMANDEFNDFLGIGESADSSSHLEGHYTGIKNSFSFERAKRADSQYRESRFAEFANRDGIPDYNKIGKFVLPNRYWEQVQAFAKENGLPLRAIILSVVCAIGAAIGALRGVRYSKDYNDFCCANLYLLNIGDISSGKSKILNFCFGPMQSVQQYYSIKYCEEYKQYKKAMTEWLNTPKDKRGECPEKPIQKTFIVKDCTNEQLTNLMMENPQGVISLNDEGRGVLQNFTKYNPKGADDLSNKLIDSYSNNQIISQRVNHEGDNRTVFIPTASIAIYANVQPDIYKNKFFSNDDEAQGLVNRFIYNTLPSRPDGEYSAGVGSETQESKENYDYRFKVFMNLTTLTQHIDPDTKAPFPLLLEFSPGAQKLLNEWSCSASRAVNYGNTCKSYYSKMLIALYRFALIMHYFHWSCAAAENGSANVSNPDSGFIEEIDVKRAIEMILICFRTLDEVLWLKESPKFATIKYLDADQQEFAKFVFAHPHTTSMTVREMEKAGLALAKETRSFAQQLRKWGVSTVGRRVPGKPQKYLLQTPSEWADSVNIKRLYFDGNNLELYAEAIITHKTEIENMGYRVPKSMFESWLGLEFDELGNPEQMIPIIKLQPLNVTEFNGMFCFLPESFSSSEEVLKGGN